MSDSAARAAITENLLARQEIAYRAGQPVDIQSLIATAPQEAAHQDLLLDLIFNEVDLREAFGETPTLEEYQQRFPEAASALRIQWDVDDWLREERSDLAARTGAGLKEQQVGRYQLLDRLGSGGIAVVDRAFDPQLKRVVALKRLKAGRHAEGSELVRFRSEAEALARVQHQYVVQVYDVGEFEGELFIAMEYCAGGSLATLLQQSPLSSRQSATLVLKIAQGISAAHQMQIIHRDLKPSNVFLLDSGPDGVPKVSDFGLAKFLDRDDDQTRTGTILGTPAYMAPEQASGESASIGPMADVYALGTILYECLTGKPPFRGTTAAATMEQVRTQEPVPVRRLQPSIPIDLETIVLHCLQKEPERRYPNAELLAADLENYLAGRPIEVRRQSWPTWVLLWCRRNPRFAALAATIAMLLLTLIVGSTIATFLLRSQRDAARAAQSTAENAQRERLQELYRALIMEGRISRQSHIAEHREHGLKAIRQILHLVPQDQLSLEQKTELRNEAIACLAHIDVQVQATRDFPITVRHSLNAAVDAKFERIAYGIDHDQGTETSSLRAIPAALFESQQNHDPRPVEYRCRAFSPDGRWLVETVSREPDSFLLRVRDLQTALPMVEYTFPYSLRMTVLHPSQPWIFVTGFDHRIHLIDFTSGQEIRQSPARFMAARLTLNRDGSQAVIASPNQLPEIVDTDTWEVHQTIFADLRSVTALLWDFQRDRVIFGTQDGRIYLWHFASNSGHWLMSGQRGNAIEDLRISPNGEFLTSSDLHHTDLRRVAGDRVLFTTKGWNLGFSEDSQRIILAEGRRVSIFDLIQDRVYFLARVPADGCEFSPDGRWLSFGGPRGVGLVPSNDLSQVHYLGLDPSGPGSFHPQTGELLTYGLFSQLWRWPLIQKPDSTTSWSLGPASAHSINQSGRIRRLSRTQPQHLGRHAIWTPDGKTLVVGNYRHGQVVLSDDDHTHLQTLLGELLNVGQLTVSSDGELIAGAAQHFPAARVWNRATGEVQLDLPGCHQVAFSSDGRWLAAAHLEKLMIYRRADWQIEHEFACRQPQQRKTLAFQPGGQLLAFTCDSFTMRLVDCRDWQDVAILIDPQQVDYQCLKFSPDGTRLAFSGFGGNLGIWDLAVLRAGLIDQGLDGSELPVRAAPAALEQIRLEVERGSKIPPADRWTQDWLTLARLESRKEDFPAAVQNVTRAIEHLPESASPAEIAELHTRRAYYHFLNNSPAAARADWEIALVQVPHFPEASRRLACLCLFGPSEFRDPRRALSQLGSFALSTSTDAQVMTLVGIAQYRLDQHAEALATLSAIPELQRSPLHRVCLAATLHALGSTEKAGTEFPAAMTDFETAGGQLDSFDRQVFELARLEFEPLFSSTVNPS